jgi:hypothetical protein
MKTFDRLHSEIKDYLAIKVPEMDEVKRLEIAGYILSLFAIREGDMLHERDKEWRHAIRNAEKKNKEARKFTIDKSVDKETVKEEIRDGVEVKNEDNKKDFSCADTLRFSKRIHACAVYGLYRLVMELQIRSISSCGSVCTCADSRYKGEEQQEHKKEWVKPVL